MKIRRRKIFRWCVDTCDNINYWLQQKFNLNPKRTLLEAQQDLVSTEELERTIGKNLLKQVDLSTTDVIICMQGQLEVKHHDVITAS